MQTIDLDLFRSLVAFDQTGSLARAADQVGRSESAVSLQLKKLEGLIGQRLFEHVGRRLLLTDEGYAVLYHARRMLAMNDELWSSTRPRAFSGRLRVGASQDFGDEMLPLVLKSLAQKYPDMRFDVEVEGGVRGLNQLEKREVDVVLTVGLPEHPSAHRLRRAKIAWIGTPEYLLPVDRPVPLVVFSQACRFKQRALEALNEARIPWEIVFKSPSLHGIWAATRANFGLTVRSSYWVPPGLAMFDPEQIGLPHLGETEVAIHYFEDAVSPEILEMIQHIERAILLNPNACVAGAFEPSKQPSGILQDMRR